MNSNITVVISHYTARSKVALHRLINQLKDHPVRIIIVENHSGQPLEELINLSAGMNLLRRPNNGMNIGAWEAATKYIETDYIIYLQDECIVNKETYYSDIPNLLLSNGDRYIYGESINTYWRQSWADLKASNRNYFIKDDLGNETRFVDYVYTKLRQWGINPGKQGSHLRSLVLAMTYDSKIRLGCFKSGTTKEECIAAEIAISKQAEAAELDFRQFNEKPFYYFSHSEWRRDGMGKVNSVGLTLT